MEFKESAKSVRCKVVEDTSRQVIINGVEQKSEILLLSCPCCDRIIFQTDNPGDIITTNKLLNQNNDDLEAKVAKYCPNCGQRITFKQEPLIEWDETVKKFKFDGVYES